MSQALEYLSKLDDILEDRKTADPDKSYVAKLYKKGTHKAAQKVGEEAVEVAMAAAMGDDIGLVTESADLLFHMMVLLKTRGFALEDVAYELAKREGLSGLAEKASRTDD